MRAKNHDGSLKVVGYESGNKLWLDDCGITLRLRGYAREQALLWVELDIIPSNRWGGTAADVSYVNDVGEPVWRPKGAVYERATVYFPEKEGEE